MPEGRRTEERRFAVGLTGASGSTYGRRLVDALTLAGHEVHVVLSEPARRVLWHEEGIDLGEGEPDLGLLFAKPELCRYHAPDAVEAAPSSGSSAVEAVVICPCSMGTLARIAHGYSIGLVERMADVALKEGRTLCLVPRETPLSVLHLSNMLGLARAGAVILPACPAFYGRPDSIEALVDFVVGKILARLRVESPLVPSWDGPEAPDEEGT